MSTITRKKVRDLAVGDTFLDPEDGGTREIVDYKPRYQGSRRVLVVRTAHREFECKLFVDAEVEVVLDDGGRETRLARDEFGYRPAIPNDPIAPWRAPY